MGCATFWAPTEDALKQQRSPPTVELSPPAPQPGRLLPHSTADDQWKGNRRLLSAKQLDAMLNRSEEQILVLSEAELQQIAGGRAGKGLIVSE